MELWAFQRDADKIKFKSEHRASGWGLIISIRIAVLSQQYKEKYSLFCCLYMAPITWTSLYQVSRCTEYGLRGREVHHPVLPRPWYPPNCYSDVFNRGCRHKTIYIHLQYFKRCLFHSFTSIFRIGVKARVLAGRRLCFCWLGNWLRAWKHVCFQHALASILSCIVQR